MLNWPPAYIVRRSKRAKRVNIRLCPERGLEIVLPARASEVEGLAFLEEHKDWVLKHHQLLKFAKKTPITLPEVINLNAIEKQWKVRYEVVNGYKRIKLLELPQELVLYGEDLNLDKCIKELKQWLYMIAEKELYLWLRNLSGQCQLPFNNLIIRNQLTRWGSCSHEKNISLNVKLLFLPKDLSEYVLIHELCHLRYLNHSRHFWNLVEFFLPNYQATAAELKAIKNSYFPDWLQK